MFNQSKLSSRVSIIGLIDVIFIISACIFILIVHGALPFISIPTLGQAVWSMGFSQSLANQSLFDLHAINFGRPEPAAIAFGLSGVYPANIFIRFGLHPSDAYSLMIGIWLVIAFFGAKLIARKIKMPRFLSTVTSTLWLCLPITWSHSDYSMLSIGIALLPLYFYVSFLTFIFFVEKPKFPTWIIIPYLLVTTISVFTDGYTFMMFAVGSSVIGIFMFFYSPMHRSLLIKKAFPIHLTSFALAYFFYISYVGKSGFAPAKIDFFRGWGADLIFFLQPSKGVHWFWDYLNLSSFRSNAKYFGDASVWNTTFSLPIIVVGLLCWWGAREYFKFATSLLVVAFFGLYMSLGPSIKIDSQKPESYVGSTMKAIHAISSTGNSLLSSNLPGFKNMRAAYRWSALGIFGFWILIVAFFSKYRLFRQQLVATIIISLLIISYLPHLDRKLIKNIDYRNDFIDIENVLVGDLKQILDKGEMVSFLPYRNDFFVNYLASRLDIKSYNIGGDKNLLEAKQHWPQTMQQFRMGRVDQYFIYNTLMLLVQKDADVVILPYIDLLWAAHDWPAPLKFYNEINDVVTELSTNNLVVIDKRDFYASVRLNLDDYNIKQIKQLISLHYENLCMPPHCLEYTGDRPTLTQVGIHANNRMQSDNRKGYLIFGPYQPMVSGEYILIITGKMALGKESVIVDITGNSGENIFARFKVSYPQLPSENILLEKKVILEKDVDAIEIRVLIDKETSISISGYSLEPLYRNSLRRIKNEANNPNTML